MCALPVCTCIRLENVIRFSVVRIAYFSYKRSARTRWRLDTLIAYEKKIARARYYHNESPVHQENTTELREKTRSSIAMESFLNVCWCVNIVWKQLFHILTHMAKEYTARGMEWCACIWCAKERWQCGAKFISPLQSWCGKESENTLFWPVHTFPYDTNEIYQRKRDNCEFWIQHVLILLYRFKCATNSLLYFLSCFFHLARLLH